MKKQMIGMLAILFAVAAVAHAEKKDPRALGVKVPADFEKHTAKSGYSLKVPPSWKENTPAGGQVSMQVMADDNICSINVVVVDEALPSRDPDELAKEIEKGVASQVSGFKLKTAENILVAGEDSPRIIYEGSAKALDFRWQQTMVVKGGKTYIVTFTALAASYDKYASTVDQILESIEIPK